LPFQLDVLKTVVEHEYIDAEVARKRLTRIKPVRADADRGQAGSQKDLCLIAGMLHGDLASGRQQQMLERRAPAVATRENARIVTGLFQVFDQVQNERCLSRSPHGDIADTDDRLFEAPAPSLAARSLAGAAKLPDLG